MRKYSMLCRNSIAISALAFEMAMAASSGMGGPCASAGPSITVATLNIGVKEANSMSSKKKFPEFRASLSAAIGQLLAAGVEVICLQEINKVWRDEAKKLCPPNWYMVQDDEWALCTLYAPTFTRVAAESVLIFPGSTSYKKAHRKVLRVDLRKVLAPTQDEADRVWSVWNNHTAIGDSTSGVSGDIRTFALQALRAVAGHALAAAQGKARWNTVLCGDWNGKLTLKG